MSRGAWVRFLLVLGLLVGCVALAAQRQAQPGPRPARRRAVRLPGRGHRADPGDAENVDKTVEVLRGRVDALGVAESDAGPPGREPDPRRAARRQQRRGGQAAEERIGQTAQLTVHPVVASRPPAPTPSPPRRATTILPVRPGRHRSRSAPRSSQGDGHHRRRAPSSRRPASSGSCRLDFSGKGGDAWADVTGKAACNPAGDPKRRIAIVLDGEIITSPAGQRRRGLRRRHPGRHAPRSPATSPSTEAKDLAALIEGGALPLELKVDLATASSAPRWAPRRSTRPRGRRHRPGPDRPLHHRRSTASSASLATIALASYALLAYAMLRRRSGRR